MTAKQAVNMKPIKMVLYIFENSRGQREGRRLYATKRGAAHCTPIMRGIRVCGSAPHTRYVDSRTSREILKRQLFQ